METKEFEVRRQAVVLQSVIICAESAAEAEAISRAASDWEWDTDMESAAPVEGTEKAKEIDSEHLDPEDDGFSIREVDSGFEPVGPDDESDTMQED